MIRGPASLLITPTFDPPKLVLGAFQLGWFITLNKSHRSWTERPSFSAMVRNTEASRLNIPGSGMVKLPALPNDPKLGATLALLPKPVMVGSLKRLPLPAVLKPPEFAVTMVESSHPLARLPAQPCSRQGALAITAALTRFLMSWAQLPRSSRRSAKWIRVGPVSSPVGGSEMQCDHV